MDVPSTLLHKPDCPEDEPTPIPPEQVNAPVESSSVHPVLPDPPAKLTCPPVPGFKFKLAPDTDAPIATLPEPVKSRVVELKVLVLMVEENVAALATVNPPVLLKETAPVPEVVKLNPSVAISVDASRFKVFSNLSKSKELAVINDPDTEVDQDPLPDASDTKIELFAPPVVSWNAGVITLDEAFRLVTVVAPETLSPVKLAKPVKDPPTPTLPVVVKVVALMAARLDVPDIPSVAPEILFVTCNESSIAAEVTVKLLPMPILPSNCP